MAQCSIWYPEGTSSIRIAMSLADFEAATKEFQHFNFYFFFLFFSNWSFEQSNSCTWKGNWINWRDRGSHISLDRSFTSVKINSKLYNGQMTSSEEGGRARRFIVHAYSLGHMVKRPGPSKQCWGTFLGQGEHGTLESRWVAVELYLAPCNSLH